jgi:hypothetical protein
MLGALALVAQTAAVVVAVKGLRVVQTQALLAVMAGLDLHTQLTAQTTLLVAVVAVRALQAQVVDQGAGAQVAPSKVTVLTPLQILVAVAVAVLQVLLVLSLAEPVVRV